jgi:TPP-dependent pyruvate/acetoin dehydrogenase alpha subunit
VDGNDMVAMHRVAGAAVAAARAEQGPQLIEAVTYRWRGHVGHREDNDVGVQRQEGLVLWKRRDPIGRLAAGMMTAGHTTAAQVEAIRQEMRAAVEAAWQQAWADPYPPAEALLNRVYFQPTTA